MPRPSPALLICLAGVAMGVCPGTARAESATEPSLAGFGVLGSIGYGASTMTVGKLEVAPYGASFGLDLGYAWRGGFRLGGYFEYGLGRAISQHYEPRVGRSFDLTADASSLSTGLSIGYDMPLYVVVLRYSLKFGLTSMQWDFDGREPNLVEYYSLESPSTGAHVAPGIALLLPLGAFECGVGADYFVQANGAIPSGVVGALLVGVKL